MAQLGHKVRVQLVQSSQPAKTYEAIEEKPLNLIEPNRAGATPKYNQSRRSNLIVHCVKYARAAHVQTEKSGDSGKSDLL